MNKKKPAFDKKKKQGETKKIPSEYQKYNDEEMLQEMLQDKADIGKSEPQDKENFNNFII